MDDIKNIKKKYEEKIQKQFQSHFTSEDIQPNGVMQSSEYLQFKKENRPAHMNWYENACNFCGKYAPINPEKIDVVQKDIDTCHLQITPQGATSFGLFAPTALIILIMGVSLAFGNLVFAFIGFLFGAVTIFPLMNLPSYLAQGWRMQAGNQLILSVFYIVTYMRHTSNLERAIQFASEHMGPPLAVDFRKILWDVETNKFDDIFASVENYLNEWRDYSPEFIESMHVIIGSLYEGSDKKRQDLLDKSLDLLLEETYDKMLHYAHNLQAPITTLHMLGVILPILGLIILPLTASFMPEVRWYYIMVLYNFILPIMIYVMGKRILANRPNGGNSVTLNMNNPEIKKASRPGIEIKGKFIPLPLKTIAITIVAIGMFISLLPILMHLVGVPDFGIGDESVGSACGKSYCFLGYYEGHPDGDFPGQQIGPFGLGATILSLAFPFSVAVAIGMYFTLMSSRLMAIRNDTEKLENEFTGALFQLGNRLGDGLPPEIAFSRVGENMPGTRSGRFFSVITNNVQKLGMGISEAIFNNKNGALVYFPSNLIESSMRILTQSAQKGADVSSNAITNVARYIREMGRVNERLQDLMAEVISSMKSQINFLTPIIAGIVIGITAMITTILIQLRLIFESIPIESDSQQQANALLALFKDGLPTYYFSLIVGFYVVQVVLLLSMLINSVQNGVDKINEMNIIGKSMIKGAALYFAVALGVILVFSYVAISVLTGIQ